MQPERKQIENRELVKSGWNHEGLAISGWYGLPSPIHDLTQAEPK